MSAHDLRRRLFDLEVALTSLSQALAESGRLDVIEEAARKARVEGVPGAEELLRGERVNAAYRRR
ncbi:MAG: hypothetical protein IT546_01300 [Caulobacteraceae bacterium]|nr:hypothetical protein [Caulobacteraceae bacterium]